MDWRQRTPCPKCGSRAHRHNCHPSGDKRRIAELEARLEAVVAGAILPTDAVDEFTADGVRWVRVPAEVTVRFERRSS